MGFVEAVKTCFRKYIDFKGRAPRSEYWWFMLFMFLISIFLGIATNGSMMAMNQGKELNLSALGFWFILGQIINLILFVPYLAVSFRRIHDINRSAWWIGAPYLLSLVFGLLSLMNLNFIFSGSGLLLILFVIGGLGYGIVMFLWFITLGTIGPNKYGPDPLAGMHDEETLSRHKSSQTQS